VFSNLECVARFGWIFCYWSFTVANWGLRRIVRVGPGPDCAIATSDARTEPFSACPQSHCVGRQPDVLFTRSPPKQWPGKAWNAGPIYVRHMGYIRLGVIGKAYQATHHVYLGIPLRWPVSVSGTRECCWVDSEGLDGDGRGVVTCSWRPSCASVC
jgi:hypothetical protein